MINRSKRLFLFIGLTFCCFSQSFSQILDDSTKQVYGAYTTYYTTFEKIKNNNYTLTKIDTLIGGIHNFDFVSNNDYKYQNLGVIGTSMKPIYYQPPEQIGTRPGFDSYEPYYYTRNDIKFYDTKSPYTLINAIFGGGRRSMTNVIHTRNITPYWNAGFLFRRLSIEKQVSSSGRDDRQVVGTAYYLHTHYESPSGKYVGLAAFSRSNHEVDENGGINGSNFIVQAEYYDEDAPVFLENARSTDLRLDFFTYHEYKWKKQLNFYLLWEEIGNKYTYEDFGLTTSTGELTSEGQFYDQILINRDSTTDKARFTQSIQEGGIKGSQGNFYYNFHAKFRKIKYLYQYLPYDKNRLETYGGFNFRFDFDSLKNHSLNVDGEYLVGGGYYLKGFYTNKFFEATYQKTRYEPTIIEQTYFGNHDEWYNNFDPVNSDIISGKIILDLKKIRIAPSLSLINLNHNVYYNYDGNPEQAGGNVQLLHPSLELDLHFFNNSLHWLNEGIYTLKSGDPQAMDAIRIPEIFVNSRLYFGKPVFNGTVNVQIGLEAHYHSDYEAQRYDPAMRQFYLQNNFNYSLEELVVNAFLDFRIDQVAVFLEYEHVNQQTNTGYFTFPDYVGQKKVFSLGVSWMFFN